MRVLLACNHSIVSIGLREYFRQAFAEAEAVEVGTLAEVMGALTGPRRFDLLVLDLLLPLRLKESELMAVKAAAGMSPVIVFSAGSQSDLRTVINAGAEGFVALSGDLDTLGLAVRTLLAGGFYYFCAGPGGTGHTVSRVDGVAIQDGRFNGLNKLTRRQKDVLELLAEGFSNRSIAEKLGLTVSTIKGHVSKILDILEAQNRTQATLMLNRARDRDSGRPA